MCKIYGKCQIILRAKLLILFWYLENVIIIIDKQRYCTVIVIHKDSIQIMLRFPGSYQRHRQRQMRQRRRINVPERGDPTVLAILGMIGLNPHVSTRQIKRELSVPRSTSHRILATHNFHPYHITLTQQLTQGDFQQRLEFCRWAQTMLNRDRTFLRFVLFSEEATFHNTGQLNRHNSHYWSVENPHWYREINHQHRWSLIVWYIKRKPYRLLFL